MRLCYRSKHNVTRSLHALWAVDRQEIEWSEYMRFLERKQHQQLADALDDSPLDDDEDDCSDTHLSDTHLATLPVHDQRRELRTKRREDVRAAAAAPPTRPASAKSQTACLPPSSRTSKVDALRQATGSSVLPSQRLQQSLTQVSSTLSGPAHQSQGVSSVTRASSESRDVPEATETQMLIDRLGARDDEVMHLRQQLAAAHTVHVLDQQKYDALRAEYQQLHRTFELLQLAKQREAIQDEAKAARVAQTLAQHEQLLQAREAQRRQHHDASIVLQSTIRARLEQKRYQARKLQRIEAAITLQCFARSHKAREALKRLQVADRLARTRHRAATRLQRFVRRQLARKTRAMLVLARNLSAQIVQKHVRRCIAVWSWTRQKRSVQTLQCWMRQRLATRCYRRLRTATQRIARAVRAWICKWRWRRVKTTARRLQRWWRRASDRLTAFRLQHAAASRVQRAWHQQREWQRLEQESIALERLEAAVCIQALWRQQLAQRYVERERKRRSEYLEQLEAVLCIQAIWRVHRRVCLLSQTNVGDTHGRSDACKASDSPSEIQASDRGLDACESTMHTVEEGRDSDACAFESADTLGDECVQEEDAVPQDDDVLDGVHVRANESNDDAATNEVADPALLNKSVSVDVEIQDGIASTDASLAESTMPKEASSTELEAATEPSLLESSSSTTTSDRSLEPQAAAATEVSAVLDTMLELVCAQVDLAPRTKDLRRHSEADAAMEPKHPKQDDAREIRPSTSGELHPEPQVAAAEVTRVLDAMIELVCAASDLVPSECHRVEFDCQDSHSDHLATQCTDDQAVQSEARAAPLEATVLVVPSRCLEDAQIQSNFCASADTIDAAAIPALQGPDTPDDFTEQEHLSREEDRSTEDTMTA